MSNPRPTHKELTGKLRIARSLLAGGYTPVDALKLAEDFRDLDLYSEEDQMEALRRAFEEVTSASYRGLRPPAKAFERVVVDEEMLEFIWHSAFFQKKMYLKFCLPRSNDGVDLFVFSLHEDRPLPKRLK